MKVTLAALFLAASFAASAADIAGVLFEVDADVTHCDTLFDGAPTVRVPVIAPTPPSTQVTCRAPIPDTAAPGPHAVTVVTVKVFDPVWRFPPAVGPESTPPFVPVVPNRNPPAAARNPVLVR